MSAQTYRDPVAVGRLRHHRCPECGEAPQAHGNDNRFWMPGNQVCSLLERGVIERIEWQFQLDRGEP